MPRLDDSVNSVLLIEDDPLSASLIRALLESATRPRFDVTHADRLSKSLEHLSAEGIDVILLDLGLPDSSGLDTLLKVHAKAPGVPVVILTGLDDEDVAAEAVNMGAQDYLVKGEVNGTLLMRALRHAVERQRLMGEIERVKEQQFHVKNQFLSHVSHELRSPLTAIYQFVTILLDGLAGEVTLEQREYLEIGLRNVNRLRSMIDELMEVSRAETGKLTVEPECMSVAEPIVETLGTLRESAETKGIALSAEIPGSLPPVYADPVRVRQILTNLVENAIKFTPRQGSVSIRAGVYEPDPRFLSLEVADTGCGISPEGVERVFDRFYQEANNSDGSRKGLGLGLYISKELVSRHAGRIWVESQVGVGSTFALTLPVFSLARLLFSTVTENGRLRDPIALITLKLSPRPDGVSKRNLDALVKQAREAVRSSMFPDLDVLLPQTASTGDGELHLVAVCPDWRGPDGAVGRIRAELGRAPEFQSADADLTVTATLVETPLQREGTPLDELVEDVADRILELTTAVLSERGGEHRGEEEDPDRRRRPGPAAGAVGPVAGEQLRDGLRDRWSLGDQHGPEGEAGPDHSRSRPPGGGRLHGDGATQVPSTPGDDPGDRGERAGPSGDPGARPQGRGRDLPAEAGGQRGASGGDPKGLGGAARIDETAQATRILLIEDEPAFVRLVQVFLTHSSGSRFEILHVDRLSKGLEHLAAGGIDVVLLDLTLPDSWGFDTFAKIRPYTNQVPVVVLSGLDDEALAVKAVQEGAQDYLVKANVDVSLLVRSVQYAMERQRVREELHALSTIDELTGLHNRRGFLALAQQQLLLANRHKSACLLLFADLDGLKTINDTLGHREGDRALTEIAKILKGTLRESDIVARIGGDEFALLAIDAGEEDSGALTARLHETLARRNATTERSYTLSLSVGLAEYHPGDSCSLHELLSRADAMMYEQKRGKPKVDPILR